MKSIDTYIGTFVLYLPCDSITVKSTDVCIGKFVLFYAWPCYNEIYWCLYCGKCVSLTIWLSHNKIFWYLYWGICVLFSCESVTKKLVSVCRSKPIRITKDWSSILKTVLSPVTVDQLLSEIFNMICQEFSYCQTLFLNNVNCLSC